MIELFVPPEPRVAYRPRPIRFQKLWRQNGWTLKLYGISGKNVAPQDDFCAAAEALLPRILPASPHLDGAPGVGFAVMHEGLDGYFLLVDWWVPGNMLKQRVFASRNGLGCYRNLGNTDIVACVWEICVINFERDAFVKHVLRKPEEPDFAGYLSDTFDADV